MKEKISQPELIIEEDDGFKNDLLKREKFGRNLTSLVENSAEPLTISINGQWGDGKTTFVKMWQGQLKESGIHSIYFDAFSNDYSDDAFISLVSTINAYASKHSHEDIQSSSFFNSALSVGKHIGITGAKIGTKLVTLGVTDGVKEIEDIETDLANIASGLTEKILREQLLNHQEKEQTINAFKQDLAELPSKLQPIRENDELDNVLPLIIIIDELDRCKPTFAIEVLEKIKHLFYVENIVFVLAINKGQLEESIKSVYGINFDASIYLQKFISFETKLLKKFANEYSNDNDLLTYALALEKYYQDSFLTNNLDLIVFLANHLLLSLRQLEKVFTILVCSLKLFPQQFTMPCKVVLLLLAVIKVVDEELFINLSFGKVTQKELKERLRLANIEGDGKLERINDYLTFLMTPREDSLPEDILIIRTELYSSRISRKKLIPYYIEKLTVFV